MGPDPEARADRARSDRVVPLYWGHDKDGRLLVASELKSLVDTCADAAQFPPGHWYDSATDTLTRYYERPWRDYDAVEGVEADRVALREAFERAVHRQLMTDVPYGVLLSGGLDSSLVAAVAARYARHRIEDGDQSEARWPRLHSFAIGLKGSPDGRRRHRRRSTRHRPPRLRIHLRRRARCAARRDPPRGNLRRHHHPRLHPDVLLARRIKAMG